MKSAVLATLHTCVTGMLLLAPAASPCTAATFQETGQDKSFPDPSSAQQAAVSMQPLWTVASKSRVVVSPDGRLIAADDGSPRLLDVETGREVRRFAQQSEIGFDLAFSPDGKWLVAADGKDG